MTSVHRFQQLLQTPEGQPIDRHVLLQAIQARHSVRRYLPNAIDRTTIAILQDHVDRINHYSGLHIQLVLNEPKAFRGIFAYGTFKQVSNYFVMAGPKGEGFKERIGYYGEQLVLLSQILGLNTCWAGLSYTKIPGTYVLESGEAISCYIALGKGETSGVVRKSKTPEQVSSINDHTPEWFRQGVEAALLAPTAINQQKFSFEWIPAISGARPQVKAHKGFSLVGYTQTDLGIAKLHFEIGANKKLFDWTV